MSKIVRTATEATGGITPDEKRQMDEVAQLWIGRALRTTPIEREKIVPAIEGLYAAAKLKKPRVVIVPSPLVMAYAYGAAAAIWYSRTRNKPLGVAATRAATDAAMRAATDAATRAATDAATGAATYAATRAATDAATRAVTAAAHAATDAATRAVTRTAADTATRAATRAATYDATRAATYDATYAATEAATDAVTRAATRDVLERAAARACYELAGDLGLACAKRALDVYQGGNMWASWQAYIGAFRDVLGLRLPEHAAYASWEQAAIHGGFRVMHDEFSMVCDFPEVLKQDAEHRPHCENGPSHRWRDGWALYHWHGVRVPDEWITDRASLTAKTALTWPNIEQRRAACEIVGWANILRELNAKVIDRDADPEIGELVEVVIEGNRERFIKVLCGTKREFALPVPPQTKTALEGNAWTYGVDPDLIKRIEVRT